MSRNNTFPKIVYKGNYSTDAHKEDTPRDSESHRTKDDIRTTPRKQCQCKAVPQNYKAVIAAHCLSVKIDPADFHHTMLDSTFFDTLYQTILCDSCGKPRNLVPKLEVISPSTLTMKMSCIKLPLVRDIIRGDLVPTQINETFKRIIDCNAQDDMPPLSLTRKSIAEATRNLRIDIKLLNHISLLLLVKTEPRTRRESDSNARPDVITRETEPKRNTKTVEKTTVVSQSTFTKDTSSKSKSFGTQDVRKDTKPPLERETRRDPLLYKRSRDDYDDDQSKRRRLDYITEKRPDKSPETHNSRSISESEKRLLERTRTRPYDRKPPVKIIRNSYSDRLDRGYATDYTRSRPRNRSPVRPSKPKAAIVLPRREERDEEIDIVTNSPGRISRETKSTISQTVVVETVNTEVRRSNIQEDDDTEAHPLSTAGEPQSPYNGNYSAQDFGDFVLESEDDKDRVPFDGHREQDSDVDDFAY